MDDRIKLLQDVCKASVKGWGKSKALQYYVPLVVFGSVKTDLIDLKDTLRKHRAFEQEHCSHILCGDTKHSCKIISLAIRLFKPSVVYEIGRYRGWSTAQIAFSLRENFKETGAKTSFTSIDPHIGADGGDGWQGKQCGGLNEWNISKENIEKAGVADFANLVQAFSGEYINKVDDEIDFVFIDGDHTYEGAKMDVDQYGAKMISGGICILHDVWGEEFSGANYGPSRVYAEVDTDLWEKIGHTWDVGILRRR